MPVYGDLPPQLPAEEIARLARIVQAGGPEAQASIEAIVGANVRLVVSTAKKYVRAGSMTIETAVQEGIFGLRAAAERFDPERGTQFSTFAVCRPAPRLCS